jgi:hypothetical protein
MAKKSGADKPKAKQPPVERWGGQPAAHDYPAAAAYLSLVCPPADVKLLAVALREAPIERRKAKDLLRASRLDLLPPDNAHVAADLAKVKQGIALSPVLLVRGDVQGDVPLTIADGYHRICASYHLDENADIPCHLVDLATVRASHEARTRSSRATTPVQ